MKKLLLILSLLILTSSKIYSTPNPQWIWYNTSNSGISTNGLNCIEIDSNNVKWIGCESGLIRFDGNSWQIFNSSNSPINSYIRKIKKDKYNSLWFGVFNLGLINLREGNFTIYNTANSGLPSTSLWGLLLN